MRHTYLEIINGIDIAGNTKLNKQKGKKRNHWRRGRYDTVTRRKKKEEERGCDGKVCFDGMLLFYC